MTPADRGRFRAKLRAKRRGARRDSRLLTRVPRACTVDGMKRWGIVMIVLAAAACGSTTDTSHASSQVACSKFESLARDAAAGTIATSEIRPRVKSMWDDAGRVAEDAAVREASQAMLAAVTNGIDAKAFGAATRRMTAACKAAGL